MKYIVKHGAGVPGNSDIEKYELCWDTENYKLYFKSGDGELVCLNELSEYELLEGEETFTTVAKNTGTQVKLSETLYLAFVYADSTWKVCLYSTSETDYSVKMWVIGQDKRGTSVETVSDFDSATESTGQSATAVTLDTENLSIINRTIKFLVNDEEYYRVTLDYTSDMDSARVTIERLAVSLVTSGVKS